ncbi:MAG: hypothetical protein WBA10_06315 [Elainellaceae cyanobacterium]
MQVLSGSHPIHTSLRFHQTQVIIQQTQLPRQQTQLHFFLS